MQFMIKACDGPNMLEKRLAVRPAVFWTMRVR